MGGLALPELHKHLVDFLRALVTIFSKMGIRIEPEILNTVLLIVDLFYDSLDIILRLILIRV